ncbi:MAG: protein phosphatase 2C domain-containing protein [Actinomycetota bacterium]
MTGLSQGKGEAALVTTRWQTLALQLKGSGKGPAEQCQDRAKAWQLPGSAGCLLAVADGAGSTRHGGDGAERLIQGIDHLVGRATRWPNPGGSGSGTEAVRKIAESVIESTLSGLRAERVEVRDYASTFAVGWVGEREAAFAALGDAFACVQHAGEPAVAHLVLPPDREPGQTGTHFFTSDGWRSLIRTAIVDDPKIASVVLSTDGLEEVAIEYAHPGSLDDYARPRDVYFVPQMMELIGEGLDEGGLASELSVPEILDKKGDDIGLAVAYRRLS